MSSREDLIGGAERYLRRKLTDEEIQQLIHISESFGFKDNDALWTVISILEANKSSLTETLESYRGEFEAIPRQIREAANAERESLKTAGQLAATKVEVHISETVKSLVPTIQNEVAKAATTAIRRIQLGQGIFSIGAAALIATFLIFLGILLGSGMYHNMILYPNQQSLYWKQLSWALATGIGTPMLVGLGIYALVDDHSSEAKFAGWVIIAFSITVFLLPGLKVMGWWK